MGTRRKRRRQHGLWISAADLPTTAAHPFYRRVNAMLDEHKFDEFVEGACRSFYAETMGRPSLTPGMYFRLLLVGYFEGIDSERGIAWRAADSLAIRQFLHLALDEAAPDHSTISRTRRLIDLETHRAVFTWIQQRLAEAGLLTGQDGGHRCDDARGQCGDAQHRAAGYGRRLSGVPDAPREGVGHRDADARRLGATGPEAQEEDLEQRLDESPRSRCEGHEDERWPHASGPQSRACGRLETGAIVAVTLQGADEGDTTTIVETAIAAAEQVEDAQADVEEPQALEEIMADKGYHSNQTMVDLDAVGIRSYIAEPDRGRRDWSEAPEAQAPVYGNRRRIRGRRGRRLMRRRGETIERSFAHLYDTGGMRRTHLRGHTNILKRLLIHAGGFNLGLVMRHLIGVGTPRGLQGRLAAAMAVVVALWTLVDDMRIDLSARNRSTLDTDSRRVTVSSCCPSPR